MPTHWTDKRKAVALLGAALRDLGWNLFGWKDDNSDSMTDYYDPESWDGVATLGDAVACVDVSGYDVKRHSGQAEDLYGFVDDGECSKCNGTGEHPSGWTLDAARADPRRYHRETNPPGCVSLLPDVVSPIPFRDNGKLKCGNCTNGRRFRHEATKGPVWPVFQACPKGATWHVERAGRIIAKGSGVFSALRDPETQPFDGNAAQHARRADRFADIANRITAAATLPAAARVERPTAEPDVSGDGFLVRPSAVRPDYVEIVFATKPGEDVRAELKAARFRWALRSACWYGPRVALPAKYVPAEVSA